jgi:flagellar protein FliO/FliZ
MKRFVFRRSPCTSTRVLSNAALVSAATTALCALPCGAWAQAAAASEPAASGSVGGFGGELLLVTLLAVCAWTALYVWKRKRQHAVGGGHERVQVLGITSLGVRERVVVLRVRERTLLVGVTAAQITLLAELEAAAPVRSPPPGAAPQGSATTT